jgi:RNA polymerase sigma-70 factor (ECF subfamily)
MNAVTVSPALEAQWIRLAQAGDRQAYAELVRLYWPGVTQMVYGMCADQQMAEDVSQDTFLRAWQNLNSYRPGTSLRNWLYRIAANRAIDLLRREKPAADVDEIEVPDTGSLPETQAIHNERVSRVRAAVLSLPLSSRAVLILREYEGLSYQEISAALDIPLGTVMSRLAYARRKLAETLCVELEAA